MAEEYGIEETKEMVAFVISIGEGAALALEDGLGLDDVMHFMEALYRAPAAFSGVAMIPAELKDMSSDEAQELKDFIAEDFDIPNDRLESVIERSLQIGVELYKLIKEIMAYRE